jgi:ElaB/YqjD/DUF883 family membrane-anchored ribosome-binding protein
MPTSHHRRTANGRHAGIQRQMADVVESVKDLGTEVKHTAQKQMTAARDAARDRVDEGRRQVADFERSIGQQIRDRPLTALCIAAGLGWACGFLMRKR